MDENSASCTCTFRQWYSVSERPQCPKLMSSMQTWTSLLETNRFQGDFRQKDHATVYRSLYSIQCFTFKTFSPILFLHCLTSFFFFLLEYHISNISSMIILQLVLAYVTCRAMKEKAHYLHWKRSLSCTSNGTSHESPLAFSFHITSEWKSQLGSFSQFSQKDDIWTS